VTHYKKVDLMTEEDIVALYERPEALYVGTTEPNKSNTPGKRTKCHQLAHCGGVKRYKRRLSSNPKNALKAGFPDGIRRHTGSVIGVEKT